MSNTQNEQNEQTTKPIGQSTQEAVGVAELPTPAYSLPPLSRLPGLEPVRDPLLTAADLADEAGIVWDTADGFPPCVLYVRESLDGFQHFRQRIGRYRGPGRRVGYAVLANGAAARRCGYFTHRVFWLAGHDPYEGGGAPCEGVDPLTVFAGIPGWLTRRASECEVTPPAGPGVATAEGVR